LDGSVTGRRQVVIEGTRPTEEISPVTPEISTRQRILDAAIRIARKSGIKALTQPRVAAAAGVRQSHLTYYFPRKADLLACVLEASHHHGGPPTPKNRDEALRFLEALFFDSNRMRFFLGAVIEAGEANELRRTLANHMQALNDEIAPFFNRRGDDPAIAAFTDRLRGLAIRQLLEPKEKRRPDTPLAKIAAECGLDGG
jgi:AcrR family transcriptional regulator